jgi:hypothetical protein
MPAMPASSASGRRWPVELAVLLALAAWGFFPLVLLLAHASALHARFTGADGLIGADGVLGADQLQYLAWARDASSHGLASDLFTLAPSGHVYLEPLFTITGALYRLGLSLTLAYQLWKPIAIVVMFAAYAAWARRFLPDRLGARTAALILSLFLCTPIAALYSWTQIGNSHFRFNLFLLGDELLAANKPWGYVPSAFGLAMVALSLLALERAIDPGHLGGAPLLAHRDPGASLRAAHRPRPPGVQARALAACALAAGIGSWLHPWQGITLLVIFAGMAVAQRRGRWPALILPAIAAGLPLIYYYLLSHTDPAWQLASHYEVTRRPPALALLAAFGPLALIAVPGIRRPRGAVIEQLLLLWVGACFVTYFVNDSFAPHALQGLSIPFSVLAVRGWSRLRLPRVLSPALGTLAIAIATIPGLAFDARKFVRTAHSQIVQYYLPADDAAALDWVSSGAPPGGVLAPTPFSTVVPSQTGRAVWVGHGYWSRDYADRAHQVDALFGGKLKPAAAQRFVASTGARILIRDCAHHGNVGRVLKPMLQSVKHFGCASVYVLSGSG